MLATCGFVLSVEKVTFTYVTIDNELTEPWDLLAACSDAVSGRLFLLDAIYIVAGRCATYG